ncbi:unnamed protein product [Mytilus coruscus]|uniref:Uncharacterized protein n=1 Tax=Mytilus coruscus TaxID=42192 RepID=A0A6J8BT53_MYTCO|nr:unnamed protein product [Mytilus coruscus]
MTTVMINKSDVLMTMGTLAANVSISPNITGLLGNKDTDLTCSFFLEKNEHIFNVALIAKNITEDFHDKKPIAIFIPENAAKLHTSGKYLFGRVTLTNITKTSITATLKFNELKYIDEKDYMCKCNVLDTDGAHSVVKSATTRILVKDCIMPLNERKYPIFIILTDDELLSSTESALSKNPAVHAAYAVPIIIVGLIVICLAARKHRSKQSQINKPGYITVIYKFNNDVEKEGEYDSIEEDKITL